MAQFHHGQFLNFALDIPQPAGGNSRSVTRWYSVSDTPTADAYCITVKRALSPMDRPDLPPGIASSRLHGRVQEGDVLHSRDPAGGFFIAGDAVVPAVFIAGGIGITPMVSMMTWCLEQQPERVLHQSRRRGYRPALHHRCLPGANGASGTQTLPPGSGRAELPHLPRRPSRVSDRSKHALLQPATQASCATCHGAPANNFHRGLTTGCAQCHTTTAWSLATFDHARLLVLDRDHNAPRATCQVGNDASRCTCNGCHEHQPDRISAKYRREAIRDFQNCVSCQGCAEDEPEGGGRREGRGGREHD